MVSAVLRASSFTGGGGPPVPLDRVAVRAATNSASPSPSPSPTSSRCASPAVAGGTVNVSTVTHVRRSVSRGRGGPGGGVVPSRHSRGGSGGITVGGVVGSGSGSGSGSGGWQNNNTNKQGRRNSIRDAAALAAANASAAISSGLAAEAAATAAVTEALLQSATEQGKYRQHHRRCKSNPTADGKKGTGGGMRFFAAGSYEYEISVRSELRSSSTSTRAASDPGGSLDVNVHSNPLTQNDPSSVKTVYLIRHAESDENRRQASLKRSVRLLGKGIVPPKDDLAASVELLDVHAQLDSSVSPVGKAQINNVGRRLRRDKFVEEMGVQLVVHSPLLRARETCDGMLGCVAPPQQEEVREPAFWPLTPKQQKEEERTDKDSAEGAATATSPKSPLPKVLGLDLSSSTPKITVPSPKIGVAIGLDNLLQSASASFASKTDGDDEENVDDSDLLKEEGEKGKDTMYSRSNTLLADDEEEEAPADEENEEGAGSGSQGGTDGEKPAVTARTESQGTEKDAATPTKQDEKEGSPEKDQQPSDFEAAALLPGHVARVVEHPALAERTPLEWLPGPAHHDAFTYRIASFERWLARQPESVVAVVGHSHYFKTMLGLEYKFGNCDVWRVEYDPSYRSGTDADGGEGGPSHAEVKREVARADRLRRKERLRRRVAEHVGRVNESRRRMEREWTERNEKVRREWRENNERVRREMEERSERVRREWREGGERLRRLLSLQRRRKEEEEEEQNDGNNSERTGSGGNLPMNLGWERWANKTKDDDDKDGEVSDVTASMASSDGDKRGEDAPRDNNSGNSAADGSGAGHASRGEEERGGGPGDDDNEGDDDESDSDSEDGDSTDSDASAPEDAYTVMHREDLPRGWSGLVNLYRYEPELDDHDDDDKILPTDVAGVVSIATGEEKEDGGKEGTEDGGRSGSDEEDAGGKAAAAMAAMAIAAGAAEAATAGAGATPDAATACVAAKEAAEEAGKDEITVKEEESDDAENEADANAAWLLSATGRLGREAQMQQC